MLWGGAEPPFEVLGVRRGPSTMSCPCVVHRHACNVQCCGCLLEVFNTYVRYPRRYVYVRYVTYLVSSLSPITEM